MRIFISYARIDKPYCIQIVNTLDVHEVWYDQRLYAGQHWWKEIMRRLEWCEVFIYLLSPESVTSEYCLKELDVAIKLGREIIPILIHPDTNIPKLIAEMHYIDMSRGLNVDNVKNMFDSIYRAGESLQNKRFVGPTRRGEINNEPPVSESAKIVGQAATAMGNGQYDRAVYLLKRAKASGHIPSWINLDALLQEAELELSKEAMRREAIRNYQMISDMFLYPGWRKHARKAFREFQKNFPGYDPDGLARYLVPPQNKPPKVEEPVMSIAGNSQEGQHPTTPVESTIVSGTQTTVTIPQSFVPMLEWVAITSGIVRIEDGLARNHRNSVIHVDRFLMAKYPITNAQFELFLRDQRGYQHDRWWRFSKQAHDWHNKHPDPLESKFLGEDRPRETVNWYEAMAFCHWLSHRLKIQIMLPTLAQWIRAAIGDEDILFPWGNTFNQIYCNTRENGLKQTTSVTRYKQGASVFGVYDMAGNVWEWCLDKSEPENPEQDYKRGVVGGSYVSPCERAQTSERLFLNPETRYSSIGFRIVALAEDVQNLEARN